MISLRTIWIAVAVWLTAGVTLAPLPLLGCVGGLVKIISYMNSGALFALHSLLLLGYAGVYHLKLVSGDSLRTPARISAWACLVIAVPTIFALATCSSEWITGDTNPHGIAPLLKNLANPKGFSPNKWIQLAQPCPDLESFPNITTTFRSNLPTRGPSSLETPFLNGFTSIVLEALGHYNQTELKTYYFPLPKDKKKSPDDKKPPLFIFVHGGGWVSGTVRGPPSGCHAALAMENGWAYAAVEYRLGRTGWSGDVQLMDVKDAIKHILRKHGKDVDLSKVIVMGSSAGGNLALAASYQLNNEKANLKEPMIAVVAAIAPSTSVEIGTGPDSIPKWRGSWNESMATERFCENVKDCHKKLSPVEHVTQYTPPTIVLHGQQDEYYTPVHSRALMEKLAEHKIPRVYIEPPFMPHCLELAENHVPYQMVRSALEEFVNSI